MKKYILTILLIALSYIALAEETTHVEKAVSPVLVTTLIELPSKCKITEITGNASIGVRNAGKGHNPIRIGDSVDQTNIIFMSGSSKIVLLSENNTNIKLETKQNGETFTFSMPE